VATQATLSWVRYAGLWGAYVALQRPIGEFGSRCAAVLAWAHGYGRRVATRSTEPRATIVSCRSPSRGRSENGRLQAEPRTAGSGRPEQLASRDLARRTDGSVSYPEPSRLAAHRCGALRISPFEPRAVAA